jgi:hypothetical protein
MFRESPQLFPSESVFSVSALYRGCKPACTSASLGGTIGGMSNRTPKPPSDPAATAARYAFYTVVVTSLVAPVVIRIVDAWLK